MFALFFQVGLKPPLTQAVLGNRETIWCNVVSYEQFGVDKICAQIEHV